MPNKALAAASVKKAPAKKQTKKAAEAKAEYAAVKRAAAIAAPGYAPQLTLAAGREWRTQGEMDFAIEQHIRIAEDRAAPQQQQIRDAITKLTLAVHEGLQRLETKVNTQGETIKRQGVERLMQHQEGQKQGRDLADRLGCLEVGLAKTDGNLAQVKSDVLQVVADGEWLNDVRDAKKTFNFVTKWAKSKTFWAIMSLLMGGGLIGNNLQAWWYAHHPSPRLNIETLVTHTPADTDPLPVPNPVVTPETPRHVPLPAVPLQQIPPGVPASASSKPSGQPHREKVAGR